MILTDPQRHALAAVVAAGPRGTTARSVAHTLWPDSPAWHKRTRGRGNRNGALGGTMPMKAAQLLHRLHGLGLVTLDDTGRYWITTHAGERVHRDGAIRR